MIFRKIISLSIFLLCLVYHTVSAQDTTLHVFDAQIILISDNLSGLGQYTEDELLDMDESYINSLFANREYFVTAAIHVSDTSKVQIIHIRIGRTLNGADLVNASIPYNGSLPAGVVGFIKNEHELEIEFGKHPNTTSLYLTVWIEDKNGNLTQIVQVSNL